MTERDINDVRRNARLDARFEELMRLMRTLTRQEQKAMVAIAEVLVAISRRQYVKAAWHWFTAARLAPSSITTFTPPLLSAFVRKVFTRKAEAPVREGVQP